MNTESFLKQRLICVAVIDQPDDAVPLAEALLAGGLNCIEVTFPHQRRGECDCAHPQKCAADFCGRRNIADTRSGEAGIGAGRAIRRVARFKPISLNHGAAK